MKRIVGTKVYHFEELDSTNDYATQLLSKNKPIEGSVVITDHQVQGKGQYGRKWNTVKGQNITLSVILYPNLDALRQFDLNVMASMAVTMVINSLTGLTAMVKWPNDIYLNDKKVCGILIKNNLYGSSIHQSVIGIGLNVNQSAFDAALPNASSLAIESNSTLVLSQVRETLYTKIDYCYDLLKDDAKTLRKLYQSALWRKDEQSRLLVNKKEEIGIIKDINEHGKLLVEIRKEVRAYDMSQIKIIV